MENKKYSLMIVALYCYSGHVKDIIRHLTRVNPLVDITILTDNPDDYEDVVNKSIRTACYDVSSVDHIKYRWLRVFVTKHKQIRFFSKFCKNRRFDIVNIHFANRYMSFVYKYLRAMSDNIVVSPWGSDILRRPKENLEQLSYLYKKADYVTIPANSNIGKVITQQFSVDSSKLIGTGIWGSDLVDYAIQNGDVISQDDSKKRFGLFGQYVITCGYNKQEAQQHKAIIKAIERVRNQLPNNLTLLFPMNYAGWTASEKYGEELREECKNRNLHAVFVTEYLSIEDLYKLRKATDMFIHVQTSDAGARSVYEYILCNKKIVHGSWLKYEELEAFKPLFYFPVDKLENLGDVIVQAYNSDNIEIPQGVMDVVWGRGWNRKITMLNEFFMSIV